MPTDSNRSASAIDVVGVELNSLTAVLEGRMLSKVQAVLDYVSHPHHDTGVHLVKESSYRNAPASATGIIPACVHNSGLVILSVCLSIYLPG